MGVLHNPYKPVQTPIDRRLRAVEKIPLLLEALVARSKKVASELSGKLTYAQSVAASFSPASPEMPKK